MTASKSSVESTLIARELLGRLVAAVAILGHQLQDDRREFLGDLGIDVAKVGGSFFLVLKQFL